MTTAMPAVPMTHAMPVMPHMIHPMTVHSGQTMTFPAATPAKPAMPMAAASHMSPMMKMVVEMMKKDMTSPAGKMFVKDAVAFTKENKATIADLAMHTESLMKNTWFMNLEKILKGQL